MNEPKTYFEIRRSVLDCYFEGCRRMTQNGRPPEEALAYVSYQFEDAMDAPFDYFLLYAALLVLSGPWRDAATDTLRERLRQGLTEPTLVVQLAALPTADRAALFEDLFACGITPPAS